MRATSLIRSLNAGQIAPLARISKIEFVKKVKQIYFLVLLINPSTLSKINAALFEGAIF